MKLIIKSVTLARWNAIVTKGVDNVASESWPFLQKDGQTYDFEGCVDISSLWTTYDDK